MRFLDILKTAFMNLWRRKLRAFLTVLGMVIGTCSILVMVSLGIGIKESITESYASMGSLTNITVSSWRWVETGSGGGSSTEKELNKKSVETFKKIPGVVAVMPRITTYGIIKSGRYMMDMSIMGIDADVAEAFGIKLVDGKYPAYTRGGKSYQFAMNEEQLAWFYDPQTGRQATDKDGNPKITKDDRFQLTFDYGNVNNRGGGESDGVRGKTYKMDLVGSVDPSGNEFSWYALMDMEALKKMAKENPDFMSINTDKYDSVMVKCKSTDDVAAVKAAIDEMGYGTSSLQDALEQAEQSTRQVQYLLGAIGGVSLLVAAIGIMNTMMMSIYERTKEIGIIKVLGCRMGNIAALFLAEAAFIGLVGGALGLGISYGLSSVLNMFIGESGFKSVIPLWLALFAVVFSIGVAMVSGLYPALRAMRLSPLAALRNE